MLWSIGCCEQARGAATVPRLLPLPAAAWWELLRCELVRASSVLATRSPAERACCTIAMKLLCFGWKSLLRLREDRPLESELLRAPCAPPLVLCGGVGGGGVELVLVALWW